VVESNPSPEFTPFLSDIPKPSCILIVVSRYALLSSVSNSGFGEPFLFNSLSIFDIPVAAFSERSISLKKSPIHEG
jgi:hypothetical protein